MTQPPSPSAAAREIIANMRLPLRNPLEMAVALDAFAAQAVAAERAKPAASDREIIQRTMRPFWNSAGDGIIDGMVDECEAALAAALAERGRQERERCAKIAEDSHFLTYEEPAYYAGRQDAAAAIRNQTLTGD